jgi:hypothetical protein
MENRGAKIKDEVKNFFRNFCFIFLINFWYKNIILKIKNFYEIYINLFIKTKNKFNKNQRKFFFFNFFL